PRPHQRAVSDRQQLRGATGVGDRAGPRNRRRRRAGARLGGAGREDRVQRAPVAEGKQAGDRDAQRQSGAQPRAGARADRAARVVLCLGGLSRGDHRVLREAKAPVARTLTDVRAELAASDSVMAGLIERLGERSAAQRRRGEPKPDAYGALLRTVVAQQLSSKAARTIY